MKRYIAISILMLQLFTTTELAELLKLPVLVHHYFEHQDDHEQISIFEFFKTHYSSLHQTANGHHKGDHQQLPFKSHDHNFIAQSSSILPAINFSIEPFIYSQVHEVNFTNEPQFNSQFLANIWQPPRT